MDVEYELTAAIALGHAPATNDGRSASGVEWLLRTLTAECEHAITELTPFVV